MKTNPAKYNEYLENERLRKNYFNLMKSQKSLASSSSSSRSPETSAIRASEEVSGETTTSVLWNESAFSTKQSWRQSLKEAAKYLQQSPRKKFDIIESLTCKYQITIKMYKNRGRPRNKLSEEKRIGWLNSLARVIWLIQNTGCQDNVYSGKLDNEWSGICPGSTCSGPWRIYWI